MIENYMDVELLLSSPKGHVQIINQYNISVVLKDDFHKIKEESFNFNDYYCVIRIMSSSYDKIFEMLDLIKIV